MRTIELNFSKVSNPVNYKQIQEMRSFDNFTSEANNSQLMKRLSVDVYSEIIEALEDGEEVLIID